MFKFLDYLHWRTVRSGFVCSKCEGSYEGKNRCLEYNEKRLCIPCAEKIGLYVSIKTKVRGKK